MKKLSKYMFLLLLSIMFSNIVFSQKNIEDKDVFHKAKEKLDKSISGYLEYKYNYKTGDIITDYTCYAKQYFIKNNNEIIATYIMQYEENGISEYVYYNGTLLSYIYVSNDILTNKQQMSELNTHSPNNFKNILVENNIEKIFEYNKVSSYSEAETIIADAFNTEKQGNNSILKIIIDKNNNSLKYYKHRLEEVADNTIVNFNEFEYTIDSISLFTEKNTDIENLIKEKFVKLDTLINARNIAAKNK